MANIIDQNGITIDTPDETRAKIVAGLVSAYGSGINTDPNSPDGEFIDIQAQVIQDQLDLNVQNYNNFDPDRAIGVPLDRLCAINGVTRLAGTNTQQSVSVTVDRALTLVGYQADPVNAFTVADAAGNKYQLITTYAFLAAGTVSLPFQAVLLGNVTSAVNTITNIVTVTLGVVSVNNPSPATLVGTNEEGDFALRIRRSRQVALPGTGFLANLYAALYADFGVVQVIVYENDTNTTDGMGIPGHSIWVIVQGGTDGDVATAIYRKRSAGCGMKGSITYQVPQVDGTLFPIMFDRPTEEDLYIKLSITPITGTVDGPYVQAQLVAQLQYAIAQPADTTSIIALVKAIAPNASVSDEGVSNDGTTWVTLLDTSAVNNQFAVDPSRIDITIL